MGRADLLCAVFFLLAFICYAKATLTDYEGQSELLGNMWLGACLVLAAVATLCKEQGITVLVSENPPCPFSQSLSLFDFA